MTNRGHLPGGWCCCLASLQAASACSLTQPGTQNTEQETSANTASIQHPYSRLCRSEIFSKRRDEGMKEKDLSFDARLCIFCKRLSCHHRTSIVYVNELFHSESFSWILNRKYPTDREVSHWCRVGECCRHHTTQLNIPASHEP